ncbi:MAG: M23 family metallopeptidase [Halioglobus sp.]|nr:M23 family metallopeptidase [Halioglobus sp.]
MKVILISRRHGGSRAIELSRWSRALLSLCCLGLPLGLAASGYLAGQESGARAAASDALQRPGEQAGVASKTRQQLRALTMGLAELEARMTRLDALGEHLTAVAGLEPGEFDFSEPPALGGPGPGVPRGVPSGTGLDGDLGRFEAYLADRERQMEMLESLLASRNLERQGFLSGLPVKQGYLSSHFGWRKDPITGERAMHIGVDIAGKPGTEIVAAAAGVVTWTGRDAGYGNLVEISHGDDLVTRYAHNRENLVEAGDIVRKGDTIALMGASGRATGSHVHFEVYKNGRAVDPASYIARTHP